jgi:hypothetical protein
MGTPVGRSRYSFTWRMNWALVASLAQLHRHVSIRIRSCCIQGQTHEVKSRRCSNRCKGHHFDRSNGPASQLGHAHRTSRTFPAAAKSSCFRFSLCAISLRDGL